MPDDLYSFDELEELRRIILTPEALSKALAPVVDDLLQERSTRLAGAMIEALTPALRQAVHEALRNELRAPAPELVSELTAALKPTIVQVVRQQLSLRPGRRGASQRVEPAVPSEDASTQPSDESPPEGAPETHSPQDDSGPPEGPEESARKRSSRRGRFRIIGLVLLMTASLLGSWRWNMAEALPMPTEATATPSRWVRGIGQATEPVVVSLELRSPEAQGDAHSPQGTTPTRLAQAATPSSRIARIEATIPRLASPTPTPTPVESILVGTVSPQATAGSTPQLVMAPEQAPTPETASTDPKTGPIGALADTPTPGMERIAAVETALEGPNPTTTAGLPLTTAPVDGQGAQTHEASAKRASGAQPAAPILSDHDATTWLLENLGARAAEETVSSAAESEPAPVLYLTFDDGPNATWTQQILDVLAQYDAHATFFVLGMEASARPELVQAILDAGHLVGHHTWSHTLLTGLDQKAFEEEISQTTTALGDLGGHVSPFLRPPYGAVSPEVSSYAQALGLTVVRWNIDSQDWNMRTAEEIAEMVITQAGPGKVVLMHDGGGDRSQTVAALSTILETLGQQGYVFDTLLHR